MNELGEFIWPVRVYWEDTDAAGVVYYANYLKFFERARTEWLRSLGIEQQILHARDAKALVVRQASVDYRRPARYGDSLLITSRLVEISQVRLRFEQQIGSRTEDAGCWVTADVEVVCVNALTFKPARMPVWIQQLLEK